jgi:hypothetical protein
VEPAVSFPPSWGLLLDIDRLEVCGSTTLSVDMSASDGAWIEYATIPVERSCPADW